MEAIDVADLALAGHGENLLSFGPTLRLFGLGKLWGMARGPSP